jgi:hypothetical protein
MIAKLIVVGWTLFVGYAYVSGLANVSSDHAVSGLVFGFSTIVHLAYWSLVAIPTFVISSMFRRRSVAS